MRETSLLTQEELGRRIAEARRVRPMNQHELAEAVELTQPVISRIETGERSVDSLELASIAQALNVSVVDLLREKAEVDDLLVAARAQEVAHPEAVEWAVRRVKALLDIESLLDDLSVPGLDQAMPERVSRESSYSSEAAQWKDPLVAGSAMSERVRKHLGLDSQPIHNLTETVEDQLGLELAMEPLPEGLSGFCVRSGVKTLALIDSSVVSGRQRFTIAHELAHYLFGDATPICVDERIGDSSSPMERRANSFAAHFLMPAQALQREWKKAAPAEANVARTMFTFGVSLEALTWHLQNVGLITPLERRSLSQLSPKTLAYRYGFVDVWSAGESIRGRVHPPRHIYLRAIEAYRLGAIGIRPLAELLKEKSPEALRRQLEEAGIEPDLGLDDDIV